jgi:hypothetical protein
MLEMEFPAIEVLDEATTQRGCVRRRYVELAAADRKEQVPPIPKGRDDRRWS